MPLQPSRTGAGGESAGHFPGKGTMGAVGMRVSLRGFDIRKLYLDEARQRAVLDDIRAVARAAPFFRPDTPMGRPMSVRMTAAGRYGWFSDRRGYRYVDRHPGGGDWPPIPDSVLAIWRGKKREPSREGFSLHAHHFFLYRFAAAEQIQTRSGE